MSTQTQYEKGKASLINDKATNKANRQFFKDFFQQEEYKLIRSNGARKLDDASYKTLLSYISKFRNMNKWFKNKDFRTITKEEFKAVYDGLEDGKILNNRGKPFKDTKSLYNKVFRSKPFEMLGLADMARDVMAFYKSDSDGEVRFIREADFRKLVDVVTQPEHRALLWLAWDVGENINALLQLRKSDVARQTSKETNEIEYYVNLRRETLKRSRTARTEVTNYAETVKYLDIVLASQIKEFVKADGGHHKKKIVYRERTDDDRIFNFNYGMAVKLLKRAVRITGLKVEPKKNSPATWKDLRSSMACHLLSEGWTTDEINARLGHRPSSKELDKYVSFLAIDKKKPRQKIYQNNLQKLQAQLEKSQENEKLLSRRLESVQQQQKEFEKQQAERLKQMQIQIMRTVSERIKKKH